jgi:5-methylcytosine-specific restriction endonuclease McrA
MSSEPKTFENIRTDEEKLELLLLERLNDNSGLEFDIHDVQTELKIRILKKSKVESGDEISLRIEFMKEQLSETEKKMVRQQQTLGDESLRCFISGEIIGENDETEYDHVHPRSKEGDTNPANIRIVLKKYNRRKSDQSLYDVRDNLRLERLFEQKKNNIKLQDILGLKEIQNKNIHANIEKDKLTLDDGSDKLEYSLLFDEVLRVNYFYGRIPIYWLENDDQEGLQPRVIDYKRLITIRNHLKNHPQLAPAIARLVKNRVKLFDGQHKLAGQILNDSKEIDVKVYISPDDLEKEKKLFDDLMITNLEAHSKLKQVPFYTSTLLDRLSVICKDFLEEFIATKPPEQHTESNFVNFLILQKQKTKPEAKEIIRGSIKTAALDHSNLKPFVAVASKDASFPITIDLLNKTIFSATLYLEPSNAKFTSPEDHRSTEVENFQIIARLLVEESYLDDWVVSSKNKTLSNTQLKARRIWHKGSVLTWTPYLKSILYFALHFMTNDEREKLLYRKTMDDKQQQIIKTCLNRLFSHPLWDEPEGEIDTLLVSATRQEDLFNRKGLTEKYVVSGEA